MTKGEGLRLTTFFRIKLLFEQNPDQEFHKSYIRDNLNIDYYSVLKAIELLEDQNLIINHKGKYKLKR